MLITSVKDNKNNRWKRKGKKQTKRDRGAQAILGGWNQ